MPNSHYDQDPRTAGESTAQTAPQLDARQLALAQVLVNSSLQQPANHSQAPGQQGSQSMSAVGNPGLIARLMEDPRAREHRQKMQDIVWTTARADLAVTALADIVQKVFGTAMSTTAEIESVIIAYSNSPMAMAAAPMYAQLTQQLMSSGLSEIARRAQSRLVNDV
jgi:hypothetical protein